MNQFNFNNQTHKFVLCVKLIDMLSRLVILIFVASITAACSTNQKNSSEVDFTSDTLTAHLKPYKPELPTMGLLMYSGVLQSEVFATSDVFAKPSQDGTRFFNVITIAQNDRPIVTEEVIRVVPDYTFSNCPKLEALFVPSAFDMYSHVRNEELLDFIRKKNEEAKYIVSNCAGAQLIGASGIAHGKKIVTYIGGGKQLQKDYPDLQVQNDSLVSFVEDGKFSSSNGNLASYISALKLLEKMTSREHRNFVESYLYLDRLRNWSE